MADVRRSGVLIAAAIGLVGAAVLAVGGPEVTGVGEQRPLAGYRVVYRVTDLAGERSFRTEVVEVRRPYDGRVENRPGRPPGGAVSSGKVSNRVYGWQLDDGGALQFGLRRPPGLPTRDLSYAALSDASRRGVIEAHGSGSHLGRRCTWFAFEDPFPEPLAPPTVASTVETCVDRSGILLREVWRIGEVVARIVDATVLTTTAPGDERFLEGLDPKDADVTQREAEGLLQSNVVVGDDVGAPRTPLVLRVPAPWRLDRDSVVVQAASTGRATQFASRSYTRARQVVIVEIGLRRTYDPVWSPDEGLMTDLAEGRRGRALYFGDRVEMRIVSDAGFARVIAPDEETAIVFARGLRPRG